MTRREEKQLDQFWPPILLEDDRVITCEQQLPRKERRYRGLRRLIKRQLPYIVRILGHRVTQRLYDWMGLKNG